MSAAWNVGDVAILPDGTRALCDRDGNLIYGRCEFQYAKPGSLNHDGARHAVVIDPEDPEQIEALTVSFLRRDLPASVAALSRMREALRSAVSDPLPPPEPRGLGAVVRDAEDRLWSRTFVNLGTALAPWRTSDFGGRYSSWSGLIQPVTVLAEGWSE